MEKLTLLSKAGNLDSAFIVSSMKDIKAADKNYYNYPNLRILTWTNQSKRVVQRSLLKFDLDKIPANSQIAEATLHLFGSSIGKGDSHSSLKGSNKGVIQRITKNWDLTSVTWNNQPTTTTQNQVIIPESTTPKQNYQLDITKIIQDMVDNPDKSFGFLIKLADESPYKRLIFGACNNDDDALRPKLEISFKAPVGQSNPLDANIPALLMPLKIETRFIDNDLWIRVFPDEVFLQNHHPQLNAQEINDAEAFKKLINEEERRLGWHHLVTKYSAYRAGWLVQISDEELEQFKLSKYQEDKTYYFKWLPERLVFFIYIKSEDKPLKFKAPNKIANDGLPVFGSGDEWVKDFDDAVDAGMAIKIKFKGNTAHTQIARIIVTGLREGNQQNNELAELLKNHQYSKGLSVVNYGTPTNNFANEKSEHSVKDRFDHRNSFEHSVLGNNFPVPSGSLSAGNLLSNAFGIPISSFENVKNAAYENPSLNQAYQKATWFATGGHTLNMLFGEHIDNDTHNALWEHYSKYVKARGPLPTIKIGNQPYGILPVTSLNEKTSKGVGGTLPDKQMKGKTGTTDNFLAELHPIFKKLFDKWLPMTTYEDMLPRVDTDYEKDPYADILDILKMQEYSTLYQLRVREYDRVSGRIPYWIREKENLPASIPLGQLYEILKSKGYDEVNGMIDSINENYKKLDQLLGDFVSEKDRVKYAHILAFKDQNTHYTLENVDIPLTQPDLSDFNDVLKEIRKTPKVGNTLPNAADRGKKGLTRDYIVNYNYDTGAELSLFVDLLLRGYSLAARLHYRVIYFQPTKKELETFGEFKVDFHSKIKIPQNGMVITDGKNNKVIHPPFSGKIIETYVDHNQQISAGQKLFLLKNADGLKNLNREFISLGEHIFSVIKNLKSNDDKNDAQLSALREVIDLNSYRLDAWITSLATRRLHDIRSQDNYRDKIILGAYGWVENLVKDTDNPVKNTVKGLRDESSKSDGGIIHCPTPAQSMISTLFKNSFLTYRNEEKPGEHNPNPFTLNLISDRIQKSARYMDGVRQNQKVEALLGYRLERFLHEEKLDQWIYVLRRAFPLEVNIVNRNDTADDVGFKNMSVIDGLKIIEAKNNGNLNNIPGLPGEIEDGIGQLEDILDGSLDTLFFEAGFQLMRGNLERSAAAIDATVGKIEPPEPEALKTEIPGVGINHKFSLLLPSVSQVDIDENSGRAFVEPNLEAWLEEQLGKLHRIVCTVEIQSVDDDGKPGKIRKVNVNLSKLNINYSDLLYLSETPVSDGAGELELRIWNHAKSVGGDTPGSQKATYRITGKASPGSMNKSLSEALDLCQYCLAFLSKCRRLKSEDLKMSHESAVYNESALRDIAFRIGKTIKKIKIAASEFDLQFLAQFDFLSAKKAFLENDTSFIKSGTLVKTHQTVLKIRADIEKKLSEAEKYLTAFEAPDTEEKPDYHQAFDFLEKAAKTLFGPAFILLPPAYPSPKFIQIIQSDMMRRLVGEPSMGLDITTGQDRVHVWVEELAQVKNSMAAFEEWLMVHTAWDGDNPNFEYQIIQSPTGTTQPWVGLSVEEINMVWGKSGQELVHYPTGSESMVVYLPKPKEEKDFKDDLAIDKPVYGFLIDEFSEHIPDDELKTGLTFHYNAPNTEPPQSLLLAVNPPGGKAGAKWTEDDLAKILGETLDLAKIRLVDLEVLKDYGFVLPMMNWFDIPTIN